MRFKLMDIIVLCIVVIVAAAAVGVSLHYARESGVSTLPAQVVEDTLQSQIKPTASSITGSSGLAKPIKRIINSDASCAGVVREGGSADGECSPESANLPTIGYSEVFPLGRVPID